MFRTGQMDGRGKLVVASRASNRGVKISRERHFDGERNRGKGWIRGGMNSQIGRSLSFPSSCSFLLERSLPTLVFGLAEIVSP